MSVFYYCIYLQKGGRYMSNKKIGRPIATNPKNIRLDIRITKEELAILDSYCERKKVKRPQGLRDGIQALKNL